MARKNKVSKRAISATFRDFSEGDWIGNHSGMDKVLRPLYSQIAEEVFEYISSVVDVEISTNGDINVDISGLGYTTSRIKVSNIKNLEVFDILWGCQSDLSIPDNEKLIKTLKSITSKLERQNENLRKLYIEENSEIDADEE